MTHKTPEERMAQLIKDAASKLQAVSTFWQQNLSGDRWTPANGYPFAMDLDEQVAAMWTWAEHVTKPLPEPTAEQLDGWAHRILGEVVQDIADHRIPMGVRTFADLHNYVDANEYLLGIADCPWGKDAATQDDEYGVRHHNALADRVSGLLAATADMLTYDLQLKCGNDKHEHTDGDDPNGVPMGYQIPMVCVHCYEPTHYDRTIESYQHDSLEAPDCWRITRDPQASPCRPDYTNVDLDKMVDILQRLGLHAFVEMTGGGVATMYVGKVVGSDPDLCDAPLYEVCAGPGWFEGPGYSQPRATFDEFYIGADGNDDGPLDDCPTSFVDAMRRIMNLCERHEI